jgi:ABC-type phosphate transport system substrate-binding protein
MRSNSVVTGVLALCGLLTSSWAGDVYVVAHPSVTLTADEVREVFTGEKQTAGSVKLVPMDNSAAQADFLSKVIKVDANKYASIWAKKGFREGINPPPSRASDLEVAAAVKSTPGAVGYVSKAMPELKLIQKY